MVKGPALLGSPAMTASIAPLGRTGGAGIHFTWALLASMPGWASWAKAGRAAAAMKAAAMSKRMGHPPRVVFKARLKPLRALRSIGANPYVGRESGVRWLHQMAGDPVPA